MRKHADWMAHADERILEFLFEYGNHQPAQISERLPAIGEDLDFHSKYIGRRCRKLQSYGLLENLGNGVYSITDLGEQYLSEELDAAMLTREEN